MATSTSARAEPQLPAADKAPDVVAPPPSQCCFCLQLLRPRNADGAVAFGDRATHPSARDSSRPPASAEERIDRILKIQAEPKCQAAFTEWIRQKDAYKVLLDDGEKAKVDLVTQVFNIVGFFSVFQGVVLTAVSQLASQSRSQCGKVWVPIVLSGIAAAVSILALWEKFVTIQNTDKEVRNNRRFFRSYDKLAYELQDVGTGFSFQADVQRILDSVTDLPESNFWFKKFRMGYSKTKVINKTDNTIILKMGAGGILVKVNSLEPGSTYVVSSDTNATYREYWAVSRDESPLVFSSDDIAEFKEIIIKYDENKKCIWEGTVPRSASANVPATAGYRYPSANVHKTVGHRCCIL